MRIIERAHELGLKIYGGTLTPFEGSGPTWSAATEATRQAVNAWIRTSKAYDAVIDFDAVARDPGHPSRLVEERVAAGLLGKKSGHGFYDYASKEAAESKFQRQPRRRKGDAREQRRTPERLAAAGRIDGPVGRGALAVLGRVGEGRHPTLFVRAEVAHELVERRVAGLDLFPAGAGERAHALLESGKARGKVVLEGF